MKREETVCDNQRRGEDWKVVMTGQSPDKPLEFDFKDTPDEAKLKLWSPDSLSSTTCKRDFSNQKDKDTVGYIDNVSSYFGMRKIAVVKDDKGVPRIQAQQQDHLPGRPLDQGWWPDGLYTAPTDEALKYDIEMTKKFGFNMTRKHRQGRAGALVLLVRQARPARVAGHAERRRQPDEERKGNQTLTGVGQQHEAELAAMIEHLQNHPSIVMWVVFK